MPHLDSTLEQIFTDNQKSVHLMVNPRLSEVFFWHFHPEYELVYIENASGARHVGEHISTYNRSDLVLIGSNIPHLNFDYGVKTSYEKRVLHFRNDFLTGLDQPELSSIKALLAESAYGLAFGSHVIDNVRKQILALNEDDDEFDLYLNSLKILNMLSISQDRTRLHQKPVIKSHSDRDDRRLREVYAYVAARYHEHIDNQSVADHVHLSKEAFCRYFKKMTKITFTQFVNQYRINKAKTLLLQGNSIAESCYLCGFSSPSYFTRVFKSLTDEKPVDFRARIVSIEDS